MQPVDVQRVVGARIRRDARAGALEPAFHRERAHIQVGVAAEGHVGIGIIGAEIQGTVDRDVDDAGGRDGAPIVAGLCCQHVVARVDVAPRIVVGTGRNVAQQIRPVVKRDVGDRAVTVGGAGLKRDVGG